MFSKSTKDAPAPGIPASPQPAPKRGGPRSAPSIISGDLLVQGTMMSQGDLQIDGTVEGDIRSVTLTIGEKAVVKGEITAEEIIVRGRIEGRIRARKVQLDPTAVVIGDILQETLVIAAGATFEGACKRSNDPLNLQAPAAPTLQLSKSHAASAADDGKAAG
jgi:cytoskeletal protein CcmA (bactofilin family)